MRAASPANTPARRVAYARLSRRHARPAVRRYYDSNSQLQVLEGLLKKLEIEHVVWCADKKSSYYQVRVYFVVADDVVQGGSVVGALEEALKSSRLSGEGSVLGLSPAPR